MQTVTLEDYKVPNTCGECKFVGHYETGPYARNPHCCCELMWDLKEEDYKVDKDSLDEDCPLKPLKQTVIEDFKRLGYTDEEAKELFSQIHIYK